MTSGLRRGVGPWPTDNREATVSAWLLGRLSGVESSERSGMARWMLDHVSGQTKGDRLVQDMKWQEAQLDRLAVFADRVNEGEPLQHVLQEAWFDGLRLGASAKALIPRPETEELVAAMAAKVDLKSAKTSRIADWCTGSGCLALALKNRFPHAEVHGFDVSEEALSVAKANASATELEVRFDIQDMLCAFPPDVPYDMVVCNPPYIPKADAKDMHPRVLDHEPHLALFVPDDDPLVFYNQLAAWCTDGGLRSSGWLGMECHTEKAGDVAALLVPSRGWKDVEILLDLQGLPRHVVARLELP